MKGEYAEQHHKGETPGMFSKLHQHHQSQPQNHPFPHNPFQLTHECQAAGEDVTSAGGAAAAAQRPNSSGDGATIEVVRRPRGRPPGSKNKPKAPVIITRDPEPVMSPLILEVLSGTDVVQAIAQFCRRRNMGLSVLTGSGTVANITLRQPSSSPHGATVTFHGRFDILSITATFLPQQSQPVPNGFAISLAGPQGQVIGGFVAGALVAAGTVFVTATSFNNPSYHRLPPEEEARNSASAGDGHSPPVSGGGDSGHAQAESGGMSMYSCHLPSDVIWAPAPRPPPPY